MVRVEMPGWSSVVRRVVGRREVVVGAGIVGRMVKVTPGSLLPPPGFPRVVERRVVWTRVTVVICGGMVVRRVVGRRSVVVTVVSDGRMEVRRVVIAVVVRMV